MCFAIPLTPQEGCQPANATQDIMEQAGWSSENTFEKFYIHPSQDVNKAAFGHACNQATNRRGQNSPI